MPTTMQQFLRQHKRELLERWEDKLVTRLGSEAALTSPQRRNSMPLFIDEVVERLARPIEGERSALARVHGSQRQLLGRDIAELVREYGLFFEAVVTLRAELRILPDDAGLLALSTLLFDGAAEAVSEFAAREEADRHKAELKHFGFIAHELRNPLGSARLAWEAIRKKLSFEGRSVDVLSRSLTRVAELIDRTLSEARLASLGTVPVAEMETFEAAWILGQTAEDASGTLEDKNVSLQVVAEPGLCVRGDPRLLLTVLTNIVRNAVKFTHTGGEVTVRACTYEERVLIEVEDQCGGLPPARVEQMFEAFTQQSENRSGFGLGLAIAKQAVEAQGGTIRVRNVPDSGCVFVVDLLRADPAALPR